MYHSIEELLKQAEKIPLWQVVTQNESALLEKTEDAVFEQLQSRYEIMRASATQALHQSCETVGNLICGISKAQQEYADKGNTLCGQFMNAIMARALSCSEVNASMGRICACPTAGACGIVPAVLVSLEEAWELPRRKVLEALAVASGFGAVVMMNATVAGAEGGCQAECGVAAAMAATAAVYLAEGTAQQCADAFSYAMMNCMGLVCDPIAGLVQIPCAQRNASQAVGALVAADLALSGRPCLVTADEMIEAMYRVGKALPRSLRETALGGTAATASAKKIAQTLHAESD